MSPFFLKRGLDALMSSTHNAKVLLVLFFSFSFSFLPFLVSLFISPFVRTQRCPSKNKKLCISDGVGLFLFLLFLFLFLYILM